MVEEPFSSLGTRRSIFAYILLNNYILIVHFKEARKRNVVLRGHLVEDYEKSRKVGKHHELLMKSAAAQIMRVRRLALLSQTVDEVLHVLRTAGAETVSYFRNVTYISLTYLLALCYSPDFLPDDGSPFRGAEESSG